jgi:hypothetical protein
MWGVGGIAKWYGSSRYMHQAIPKVLLIDHTHHATCTSHSEGVLAVARLSTHHTQHTILSTLYSAHYTHHTPYSPHTILTTHHTHHTPYSSHTILAMHYMHCSKVYWVEDCTIAFETAETMEGQWAKKASMAYYTILHYTTLYISGPRRRVWRTINRPYSPHYT